MRDAFGGVFMVRLFLVFIVIYVGFTAVSLNYAKAFRIKNKVIDVIEQNDVTNLEEFFSQGNSSGIAKIDAILTQANYTKTCKNDNGKIDNGDGEKDGYCYKGIVIRPIGVSNNTQTYAVKTYASWNLGVLNMVLALGGKSQDSEQVIGGTWEITGEAKVVLRKS